MPDSKIDEVIGQVSPSRRTFVRRAVAAGFVAPIVGTFTMSGLMMSPQVANAALSGAISNQTIR